MKFKRSGISKLSDIQLVWLYAETREKKYAGELYLRYLPLVYGMCLYGFPDVAEAKEAVTGIFARVCDRLVTEAEKCEDFKVWLCAAAEQYIDEHTPELPEDEPAEEDEHLSLAARGYAALLAGGDAAAMKEIDNPAHKLSLPQKQTLKLFFGKGRSFADIASQTGILNENVRTHVIRGLEALAVSKDTEE